MGPAGAHCVKLSSGSTILCLPPGTLLGRRNSEKSGLGFTVSVLSPRVLTHFLEAQTKKALLKNTFFTQMVEIAWASKFGAYLPGLHYRLTQLRDCLTGVLQGLSKALQTHVIRFGLRETRAALRDCGTALRVSRVALRDFCAAPVLLSTRLRDSSSASRVCWAASRNCESASRCLRIPGVPAAQARKCSKC